jgi:transposase-like protein
MTRPFSPAFKTKAVGRLLGKDAISARQLGKEIGVQQTTLSRWLEEARSLPRVPPPKMPHTVDEKIEILSKGAALTGEQLSAYLEQHGVSLTEFEHWRLALDDEGRSSKTVINRIRGLERELARKEKALAEAAALLILKKRLQSAFGVEDDDTDEGNEK